MRVVGAKKKRGSWIVGLFLAALVLWVGGESSAKNNTEFKSWAVVIGINDYERVTPRLHYAANDAEKVAALLKQKGYEVVTLFNRQATRTNILKEMGTKLLKKVGPQDRVLIYFSGHGRDWQVGGGTRRGFLLPIETDPEDLDSTAISMFKVRELANALPAKHVLFLIDACYGGIAGTSKSPTPIGKLRFEDITREPGRWLITAGGADQEALEVPEWKHGLFTYYLLKGLGYDPQRGLQTEPLADLNRDGIIPGSELWKYLEDRVYEEGQIRSNPQRPEWWTLAGDKGEFVFLASNGDRVAPMPPSINITGSNQTVAIPLDKGIVGQDGAPMVFVSAGEFLMGASSADKEAQDDEKPQHRVTLDAFHIDQYEVTASRYNQFMGASSNPKYWGKVQFAILDDRPVVGVTWDDAKAYCEHYDKRLPTEAEWEKAARGTDDRIYPWGNERPTSNLANFDRYISSWETDLYSERLKPVGSFEAGKSLYGVHDMAGNVWEWVEDGYDKDYYSNSPKRNPKGPGKTDYRVVRGGSWLDAADLLRSSYRLRIAPAGRGDRVGFRCARTPG